MNELHTNIFNFKVIYYFIIVSVENLLIIFIVLISKKLFLSGRKLKFKNFIAKCKCMEDTYKYHHQYESVILKSHPYQQN